MSDVEPVPWQVPPWVKDDPRYRSVLQFVPEFGHLLAHHLPKNFDAIVRWGEFQRAAGVDGKVIAWRGDELPEDPRPGPDIKDHDAVFRYFLREADVSDDEAKKKPVSEKDNPFADINLGVLVGEGAAARIVSGVIYASATCEIAFQEEWYEIEEFEHECILMDFWQHVSAHLSPNYKDTGPMVMPKGVTQSFRSDWDMLEGAASIVRAVGAAHGAIERTINSVREKSKVAEGCYGEGSAATFGVTILVKPAVSLKRTAIGWTLEAEVAVLGEDRSLIFSAFTFDEDRRCALGYCHLRPHKPAKRDNAFRLLSLWYKTDERVVDFKRALARDARKRDPKARNLQFTVPKWMPRGTLTLLAADGSTGKTTLLHHLVKIVGTPPADRAQHGSWLGIPLNEIEHGAAAMFTAEEPEEWIDERDDALDPDGVSLRGACWDGTGLGLDAIIAQLEGQPDLALVVIDPARKFLDGNESSSEDVDRLLTKLQELARKKNCAVVVVHHLTKGGGGARGLSGPFGVKDYIRGSQVWVDRPRVVIAMQRKGSDADGWIASLKVVKSNVPPAYPMATDLQSFKMDPKTRTLVPIGEGKSKSAKQSGESKAAAPTDAEIKAVCAAVSELVAAGGKVTRTGRRELFGRVPALAGIPRSRLRRTVAAALAAGSLKLTEENYIELSASP
jgi:hypothetical protein